MAEVTYYFNGHATGVVCEQFWSLNVANFVDNNLETFESTSIDGCICELDENTCPGDNLGAITKVELRVYGYGDGDDRIDLTPVFAGIPGNEYQLTMPSTAGWSAYADITSDPALGVPWDWSIVQGLDCKAEFDKVAKGNTMYGAKMEIRVTYTPSAPPTESGMEAQLV